MLNASMTLAAVAKHTVARGSPTFPGSGAPLGWASSNTSAMPDAAAK